MALREDLNAALAALNPSPEAPKVELDESGRAVIPVPMPPTVIKLAEGQLPVEVSLAKTGAFFTLSSPIAVLKGTASRDFYEALLQRQFYADQVSAASFGIALVGDQDVVLSLYHWMLDSITSEEFTSLFKHFISATFDLIEEVNDMAKRERKVKPIHKGRP